MCKFLITFKFKCTGVRLKQPYAEHFISLWSKLAQGFQVGPLRYFVYGYIQLSIPGLCAEFQ